MSNTIECKICNKIFNGMINGVHLRSHGITTTEYRQIYGENITPETHKKLKQAASLGAKSGGATRALKKAKEERIRIYNLNPRLCEHCSIPLPYDTDKRHRFCSHTCGGFSRSTKSQPSQSLLFCKHCFQKIQMKGKLRRRLPNPNQMFCSHVCWRNYTREQRYQSQEKLILAGQISDRYTLRNYLIRKNGYKCEICNLSEWQGFPMPLALDHIDGNAGNDLPANLRVLCYNCHAQTPTFGWKNKGFGRRARGLKQQ